ncbi:uncharacterized protein LOC110688312 [Chenopodium quinoa]|uniref:DUF6598 domain-containing protein n=1 Tax=Chenopodium quinoa TaxID=63459 RepID=A0A803KRN7_CHEQI|nr:uncharacterized protein LOC110688312 [Chenopodium quinoa]
MDTESNWEDYFSGDMLELIRNTPEEVEVAKKECVSVSPSLIRHVETEKSSKLSDVQKYVPTSSDIKALNIIEFFSVIIQRDTTRGDDLNDFEIYGHIKLTNDYGKEFFLFKQKHRHPVTVCMMDKGLAILPKFQGYQPRWVPKYFWLKLYLKDKTRNVTIVDAEYLLDFRRKVVYDKEQSVIYNSKGKGYGIVTLNYTVFRCALFALTTLGVYRNGSGIENDKTDEVVTVSGSISASTQVEGKRELSRVLCDISMSLTVNNDDTMLPVVAVPAYSLLRIKPDLVVNGERIVTGNDTLECKPEADNGPCCKKFMVENWCICLGVFFIHPYRCLQDEDEFIGELISYDTYKILYEDDYGSSDSDEENLLVRGISTIEESQQKRFWPKQFSRELVEVFSVYVGSFSPGCTLSVFGTIKYETISFENEFKGYLIFEREEVKPEVVFPYKPISLLKPCNCYEADNGYFAMHLDLKDVGGREISNGCMKWHIHKTHRWYDKRICSVVTGEHGFACVHYVIFHEAVSARVRVRLLSLNSPFQVYGSIYARYSEYRCSTNYERKFYRSMLFRKEKSEVVESCGRRSPDSDYYAIDIPLSKDLVAVQSSTKLILDVKLHVQGGGKIEETIRGELKFDPEGSTMVCAKKIEGQKPQVRHLLVVEVEWS